MTDTLRGDMKALREGFTEFGENTMAAADDLGLESPVLSRPRQIPCRMEDAGAPPHCFKIPEELYFQVMETASTSLDWRFSPSAFKHMQDVEEFVTEKATARTSYSFNGMIWMKPDSTLYRDMCMDIPKQQRVCLAILFRMK